MKYIFFKKNSYARDDIFLSIHPIIKNLECKTTHVSSIMYKELYLLLILSQIFYSRSIFFCETNFQSFLLDDVNSGSNNSTPGNVDLLREGTLKNTPSPGRKSVI